MSFKNNYKLPIGEYKRTYNGIRVTLPVGYEITSCPIYMDVVLVGTNRPAMRYYIGKGIEVLSDLSFQFVPGEINLPAGNYEFDILIQYPSSIVSFISGTWEIRQTITIPR